MQGLLGRKRGMTRVFDDSGRQFAVTVIEAAPGVVVQRKTRATDGYDAVQVGFGEQPERRATRAHLGHVKRAGSGPWKRLREFALDPGEDPAVGDPVTVALFAGVSHVDVVGRSKGRGFQGVVKRHRMGGGRATHGAQTKRAVGSIGSSAWPSRVVKGKRMPGHMGSVRVTVQNLEVFQVKPDDNVILVRGAVPGPRHGLVEIRKAIKKGAPRA